MNIDVTISIHALLAESDYSMGRNEKSFRGYFYPRSPCGERLRGWTLNINGPIFLSTLSLRRATVIASRVYEGSRISIHALLAESDWVLMGGSNCDGNFYPRSPCGERHSRRSRKQRHPHFYPRSPCGERRPHSINYMIHMHFYPRSPCGERRCRKKGNYLQLNISIHALLAESDGNKTIQRGELPQFLSTLSLRRATIMGCS